MMISHRSAARHSARFARCRALLYAALAFSATAQASPAPATIHPASWPASAAAFAKDPKIESFVERLLDSMTIEEKVGQLIQADIASVKPEDLRQYHLGSILAGGNAAPGADVRNSAASWIALTDAFYRSSVADKPASHAAIPVIFGIDAVHGNARVPGGTVFPHNVGLGAAHDPDLIERIGRITAEEVSAIGVDWTFAPTVAVVRDVRWGRSYESYSEDPVLVADYARAMVTGLQGRPGTPDFLTPGHTLASVKHFLGDGGTRAGRDQFDNQASEEQLRDVHGLPYPAALSAGALIVMASYNSWHGTKMHASYPLLTDVLKGRWSFPGFVVGDWNAQEEVPGCTKFNCADVLAAGLDMYMAPDSWKQLYENLLADARAGRIPMTRINDAVGRVLRVKAMDGVFAKAPPAERGEVTGMQRLGTAEHRAVAREAVRKSLVLLKNNGGILPLEPAARVLVTGPGADDIGMQSGGWTIDWQGDHNRNSDFPGATSIYAGIRAAVERAGGVAELSADGSYKARPAAAIVVFGETPYAEFEGDLETLDYLRGDARTLPMLRRLHAAGIPVISVFLSGRPMWVNPLLNASDAFVAAWLPGTEGGGIADLLFRAPNGERSYDFTGRLSFSWPATALPVHFGAHGKVSGALFARGYGLSGGASRPLGPVAEDRGVPAPGHNVRTLFANGHVTAPWSIYVEDRAAEVRLTLASQVSTDAAVTTSLTAGSVSASWTGKERAEFRIGGRAASYGPLAEAGTEIVARYQVDVRPTGKVFVGMRCEAPYGTRTPEDPAARTDWRLCGASGGAVLDLTQTFRAAPRGHWQTLRLPLACLVKPGTDLGHVSAPFAVETDGSLGVSFEDVRLVQSSTKADCPKIGPG